MGAEWQNIQLMLAFVGESRSEAPMASSEGTYASAAVRVSESPAVAD